MDSATLKAYMDQRKAFADKLIALSTATEWRGYEVAARDLKAEIARIDMLVAKPECPPLPASCCEPDT